MPSTQQHLPIQDIQNDLVFLKDGSVSLVIETSAVNFGLLFDTEQAAIIQEFAGLLNSLSFPIQIVVHSKKLDVSSYLYKLDQVINLQQNLLLKNLTQHYRQFVESLISENEVLDKKFYVCVSVGGVELGLLPKGVTDRAGRATTIIKPRRDHVVRQLNRIGLKTKVLRSAELVKLFYEFYNNTVAEDAARVLAPTEGMANEKVAGGTFSNASLVAAFSQPAASQMQPPQPPVYPQNVVPQQPVPVRTPFTTEEVPDDTN